MSVPTKILCLDDDDLTLRSVVRALESGASGDLLVEGTTDLEDARRRVLSGEYGVLVTDYDMPEQDGIAFVESFEDRSDIVSVLLTGHIGFELALEAINRGHVYAYLQKPFRPRELLATVRRAAERFELGRALHLKVAELEQANRELRERNEELVQAREALSRLRDQAATDHKTGAHSYRFFEQRLAEEVARAERYGLPLSLLLIDLDGFKRANDRLGHLAGDEVLRAVAGILRDGVRVMDVVARYGGDEFVVLLPNTTQVGAAVLAERLRVALAGAPLGPARVGEITASIGISFLLETDGVQTDGLLETADRALYEAKSAGRNQCVLARRPAAVARGRS